FQYNLVDNIFSMTVATMGAAALFFFMARSTVGVSYRPALLVSGIVVAFACYHYFIYLHSWNDAYALADGPKYAAKRTVTTSCPGFIQEAVPWRRPCWAGGRVA
ncbi:MAG: hypothetical protein ACK55N_16115, partial [Planctomycetota bacterium]